MDLYGTPLYVVAATQPLSAEAQVIRSQVQRRGADGPHAPLGARGEGLLLVGRAWQVVT